MAVIKNEAATVAKPLALNAGNFNSPLDSREKLVIDTNEVTLEDFQSISEPYIHMRVHVHQQIVNTNGTITQNCLGVYEVDELEEYTKGLSPKKYYRIKTYHKVFSATSGLYSAYQPNGVHKDTIYYCTDNSGDYQGKVFLNGSSYGGGQACYRFNSDHSLLIVSDDGDDYACPVTPYIAPQVTAITPTPFPLTNPKSVTFAFTANVTGCTFQYAIWNGTDYGQWTNGSSVTIVANEETETTIAKIKVRAIKNGLPSEAIESSSVTLYRYTPTLTISASGDKYDLERTITITPDKALTGNLSTAKIFYTLDGSTPTSSSDEYNASNKPKINKTKAVGAIKAICLCANWKANAYGNAATIEAGVLKMWYGVVNSIPNNDAGVLALSNSKKQDNLPLEFSGLTGVQGQYLIVAVKKAITVNKIEGGGFTYSFTSSSSTSYNIYAVQLNGTLASTLNWKVS